jgi:FkbM family methyltransferase
LDNIQKGKYIDIGSHHPITDSASRVFYEQGWRGIHIEPLSSYAKFCAMIAPRSRLSRLLYPPSQGFGVFYIQGSDLSTADSEISPHHHAQDWNLCEIIVPTVTLDNIFWLIHDDIAHWLKIDVEGYERKSSMLERCGKGMPVGDYCFH